MLPKHSIFQYFTLQGSATIFLLSYLAIKYRYSVKIRNICHHLIKKGRTSLHWVVAYLARYVTLHELLRNFGVLCCMCCCYIQLRSETFKSAVCEKFLYHHHHKLLQFCNEIKRFRCRDTACAHTQKWISQPSKSRILQCLSLVRVHQKRVHYLPIIKLFCFDFQSHRYISDRQLIKSL